MAAMAIGGNTTMIHLLLGLSPWPVFETPFAPVARTVRALCGHRSWALSCRAMCMLFPAARELSGRGYHQRADWLPRLDQSAGAVRCLLISGRTESWWPAIPSFLLAGAGAAGPALEGGISSIWNAGGYREPLTG